MASARQRARRIALPVALMLGTGVYLAKAFDTTSPYGSEVVSVRFFPILVAIALLVALATVAAQELRRADAEDEAGAPGTWRLRLAPALIVGLTAVYVAVFVPLGYFLATGLYVLGLLHVFAYTDVAWPRRIVAAVAITLVGWVLFAQLFNVRLPAWPGAV